jgi:hypothetical protein
MSWVHERAHTGAYIASAIVGAAPNRWYRALRFIGSADRRFGEARAHLAGDGAAVRALGGVGREEPGGRQISCRYSAIARESKPPMEAVRVENPPVPIPVKAWLIAWKGPMPAAAYATAAASVSAR